MKKGFLTKEEKAFILDKFVKEEWAVADICEELDRSEKAVKSFLEKSLSDQAQSDERAEEPVEPAKPAKKEPKPRPKSLTSRRGSESGNVGTIVNTNMTSEQADMLNQKLAMRNEKKEQLMKGVYKIYVDRNPQ